METKIDDLGNIGIVVADWDITNSYRPRTITCDYTSWIAYISRKPVPANIPITDVKYWKPIFRLDKKVAFDYQSFKDYISKQMDSLNNVVETFLASKEEGNIPLATEFGNSNLVGITQGAITKAINKIWDKLEEVTGETLHGIGITATPSFFIGEDGCNVTINAKCSDTAEVFEHISLFLNGELIVEADNVETLTQIVEIDDTSVVKCVAKILGVEYSKETTIIHYNSFWLGAGNNYADIMNEEHVIPITNGMRGAYDITVEDEDHIIVVVGASLRSKFLRADLNSFEIPFDEHTVTVNGIEYIVFESKNVYEAGTYNIDING